uniref:Uncharacterized protein n=1 Tax=Arundo donax TaxID=35708 RepID=A0A0A9AQI6_ARUDO
MRMLPRGTAASAHTRWIGSPAFLSQTSLLMAHWREQGQRFMADGKP